MAKPLNGMALFATRVEQECCLDGRRLWAPRCRHHEGVTRTAGAVLPFSMGFSSLVRGMHVLFDTLIPLNSWIVGPIQCSLGRCSRRKNVQVEFLLVLIVGKDGSTTPVSERRNVKAKYAWTYFFTLSGNDKDGFVLNEG